MHSTIANEFQSNTNFSVVDSKIGRHQCSGDKPRVQRLVEVIGEGQGPVVVLASANAREDAPNVWRLGFR